ncbi:MAG: hypothetical protein IJN99_04060 [Clostridia bacterium]|nr:hypothetical protein [Clostridia bacterium]
MDELFEIFMVVLFGVSWPLNVIKSYQVRTTKGKSLSFLILIFVGYIFGIASKLLAHEFKWYVLFFYILNFVMVGMDLILYVRNYRLDKKNELMDKELTVRKQKEANALYFDSSSPDMKL